MKKQLITILLILTSLISFGQVAPGKLVTIQNATTAFGQPLSKTDMVKDANTGKVYNVLLSLAGTKTIATCTLGTDITELPTLLTATSGTFTPTITNYSNSSGLSVQYATYIRMGNIVHCQVSGSLVATLANTDTIITISLPITSTTDQTGLNIGVGTVTNENSATCVPMRYVSRTSGVNGPLVFTYISSSTATDSGVFSIQFDYSL